MLTFQPLEPKYTAGLNLEAIRIHVRGHKLRELSIEDRTLEAHYTAFVVTQSRKRVEEARQQVSDLSHSRPIRDTQIAGRPARVCELGTEPPPGDIGGRRPSVVCWHDAEIFYLIASDAIPSDELVRIATSLYR